MLKKYMFLLLLLFPANVCFANDVLPIYMWQMLETDNLSNVDSDINNPYKPICNKLNINNVINLIIVVIIVTVIVYFA